jgi:signal transduction histidine kinase
LKKKKRFYHYLSFRFLFGITCLLTVVLAAVFFYFYQQEKDFIISQVDKQAHILCQQVLLTRSWLADMGGVYVEKKSGLKVNPYLKHSIIQDRNSSREYLLRNPAMVTRELSEYADQMGLYSFRLTSTILINPTNAPDGTERLALDLFRQRKVKEYVVRQKLGGRQVFRLITPLYIESACLSCHQYQGYEPGTLRGCISIIIPNREVERKIISLKYSFITAAACIILFTVLALFYMNHLLAIRPLRFLGRRIQRFETDINYPVPISARQDEIGELERSFAQMVVTVRESQLKMEGKIARATAELRKTNKELREVNLLLEQQDQRKTHFLANVSHELRTPLTAIRGGVDYLLKTVNDREQVVFLQILDKNIASLVVMVNNLIDLARIELDKVDLDMEEVNVKELLDEVVQLFQGMAREKEVTIDNDRVQEKIISLDYRRMNQVFINLLHNAVKFSPVGGIITLEMKVGADEISISMLNQSEQIPAHELKSIFFRYKTRQETGMRGVGLGLAIARGLVQAHGGRLEVSSVAAEIRFTVILPLGKSDPEDEETTRG